MRVGADENADAATGPPLAKGGQEGGPLVVSTRSILVGAGLVVVLAVGLVALLGKAAGYSEVLGALGRASGPWVIGCLVLEAASYAGYVVCLRAVVAHNGGPALPGTSATRVWLASMGATRLVSPAGVGGLALMYWLLRKAGLHPRDAAARVLGLNILLFSMFGIWALATSLVILIRSGGDAPLGMIVPWLVVVPVIAVTGLWISEGERGERVSADTHHGWLRKGRAAFVAGIIVARTALRPPRLDPRILGGATVYWVGDLACLWGALRAIGAEVSLPGVALAYATAYVAMLLPLPTGGYGALDAASAFTLTMLGLPLAEAIAGVMVWRVFNFWLPTIPALIEVARSRDLARTLARDTGG